MVNSVNSRTPLLQSSKGMASSGSLLNDLLEDRVTDCQLYFGGIVLPYAASDVRLDGLSYVIVGGVSRPGGSGWHSELSLLYYRELLRYRSDPLEAAALGDEYWCKHRIEAVLVRANEVIRMQVIHMHCLKRDDCPDPVERLECCFRSV